MAESNSDWFRAYMDDTRPKTSAANSEDNIMNFGLAPYPAKNPGAAALDLVYQAAELIGDVDNYAAERQARAEALATQALEKLKVADDRVRAADSARRAAEAGMQEFSDRVEKQLNGRVQELEKEMERLVPRLASTEGQLAAALQRAKAAELRAKEAENALKRVEETIRTKILEKRLVDSNRRPIRAA